MGRLPRVLRSAEEEVSFWRGRVISPTDCVKDRLAWFYHGNDTDWHLAAHRRAGFADRTYIALAVDSRRGTDPDGRQCPRWASDAAEVERQVRSLRAARPEMMGVALYANYAEPPLIAEADALARQDLRRKYGVDPLDVEAMLSISFPKP